MPRLDRWSRDGKVGGLARPWDLWTWRTNQPAIWKVASSSKANIFIWKEYESHLRFRNFGVVNSFGCFFWSIWLWWYYELLIYNDKYNYTHKYVLRSFQHPSRPDPLTSSMSTGLQHNNSWTFWQMSQWPLSVVTVCGSTTTSMSPTSWHNVVGEGWGFGVGLGLQECIFLYLFEGNHTYGWDMVESSFEWWFI